MIARPDTPETDGSNTRTILGVRFFTGTASEAVERALQGGLIVVPSAPVLVNAAEDPATRAALVESDLAITDSGLMVLFWKITRREKLRRLSGLEYLQSLLTQPSLREPGVILWVMPNQTAIERNMKWLCSKGFPASLEDNYLAPVYPKGPLIDECLRSLIEIRRPAHVIMAIGGNVQERLGHYLIRNLPYRPAIHGTGAAIGFLNGDQVHIPEWADRYFLGWLFRCLRSPMTFVPRYWNARKLVSLLWRFGAELPELERR